MPVVGEGKHEALPDLQQVRRGLRPPLLLAQQLHWTQELQTVLPTSFLGPRRLLVYDCSPNQVSGSDSGVGEGARALKLQD